MLIYLIFISKLMRNNSTFFSNAKILIYYTYINEFYPFPQIF